MNRFEIVRAFEQSKAWDEIRVALVLPDGQVVSGPVVGIQDVQEDGETVAVIVANAHRIMVI